MLEASFIAAFAGGVLALLSPCSALLLPAFFAYAFTSRTELLSRTLVFLAGMSTVFVPLGLGASLVAALLLDYRDTTILVAGLVLIAFGLLEIANVGFTFVPQRLAGRVQVGRGISSVYFTGLVYGVSGFCAGPLLGAVLTIASTTANPLVGAGLLFAYSLGSALPLFLIAWLWDRYQLGQKAWLRGRPLKLGPLHTHTTSLAAGSLFILLGLSFIAFQGATLLTGIYTDLGLEDLGFRLQERVAQAVPSLPEGSGVAFIVILVVVGWLLRRRKPDVLATPGTEARDARPYPPTPRETGGG